MTSFTWKSGVSGDWGVAANWLQDAVPNATTADVTIAAAGDQVSIAVGESFTVDSVTVNSATATLGVSGVLSLGGTSDQLVVQSGFLDVAGTIANGTVVAGSGTISFATAATLEDVTYKGNLAVAAGQRLDIVDGLAVETASGALPGTINVGDSAILDGEGSQTLNHAVINLGSSTGGADLYYDLEGDGGTLTLGSGETLNSVGTNDQIFNDGGSGATIVSAGTINVKAGSFTIGGGNFVNTGSISVAAGATLEVNSPFANSGSISVAGTLDLDSFVTLASLHGISASSAGVILIANTLDLGAGSFTITGVDNYEVAGSGTIANGTVVAGSGTISFATAATLEDVTYKGNLAVAAGQRLDIVDGLAVETASGALPGTINVGDSAILDGEGSQTLNHAVINLGSSTGGADLYYDLEGDGGTLTLGSGETLNSVGTNDQIFNDGGSGATIVSAGTINVKAGSFTIGGGSFVNTGSISVAAGATLEVNSPFANSGSISVAGTLDLDSFVTLASLHGISASSAGVILIANTLDLGAGSFTITGVDNYEVAGSGTIANGTVVAGSGTISFATAATLEDVTYKGNLAVAAGQRLDIVDGLAVETASGALPGTINVGDSAILDGEGSQTLNHAVINLGSSTGGADLYYDLEGDGGTLTLGSGETLNSVGTNDQIFNDGGSGATIVSAGTINVKAGSFTIGGGSFVNTGSISVAAGATLEVNSPFANSGSISVAGTLDLDSFVTLASLHGISASSAGVILIANTLDLGAGSFTITGVDNYEVAGSGTIANGTVVAGSGTISFATAATLEDVTYKGNLAVAAGQRLDIVDGLAVETASGALPGTINVGDSAILDGEGSQTLNHAVINLGSSTGGADLYYDLEGDGGTLTLGSGETLNSVGTNDQIFNDGGSGATIVSAGTINVKAGSFTIGGGNFVNTGSISVAAGATLDVGASTFGDTGLIEGTGTGTAIVSISSSFANYAAGKLSGGKFEALAGDTLALSFGGNVTSDNATLILNGIGSEIKTYSSSTSSYTTLESSLATINTTGELEVLADRNYTTSNTLAEYGKIVLNGGNFAPAALTINSAGIFSGYGTVSTHVTDNGSIISSGTTLSIVDSLSGSGAVVIGANSGVVLEAGIAATAKLRFGGVHAVLTLDQPTAIPATLVSLAPSDTIDLISETVSSATIAGGKLVVSLSVGGTIGYNLSLANALDHVATTGDGHGGSDIVIYSLAKAAITPQPFNFGIRHVGDVVSQHLTIGNTAILTYGEMLDAKFSGTTLDAGSYATSGTISLLAAGAKNSTSLALTLATSSAGTVSGTTTIALTSDGTGVDGLGTTALAAQTITVTGTVNNYATATIEKLAGTGTLGGSGSMLTLNLGDVAAGATLSDTLGVLNSATGPADVLSGSFSLGTTTGFTDTGFNSFSSIAAGTADSTLAIKLSDLTTGTYSETIVLSATGSNASGYTGALAAETLVVTGTVTSGAKVAATPREDIASGALVAAATHNLAPNHASPITGRMAWHDFADFSAGQSLALAAFIERHNAPQGAHDGPGTLSKPAPAAATALLLNHWMSGRAEVALTVSHSEILHHLTGYS